MIPVGSVLVCDCCGRETFHYFSAVGGKKEDGGLTFEGALVCSNCSTVSQEVLRQKEMESFTNFCRSLAAGTVF